MRDAQQLEEGSFLYVPCLGGENGVSQEFVISIQ